MNSDHSSNLFFTEKSFDHICYCKPCPEANLILAILLETVNEKPKPILLKTNVHCYENGTIFSIFQFPNSKFDCDFALKKTGLDYPVFSFFPRPDSIPEISRDAINQTR